MLRDWLYAQVNDKCSDSSHSPLKRNCSTKWIENHDVFVFKEFYPAVVGSFDYCQHQKMKKFLKGLCLI